jgi:D-alanyl-D-alanine carboxypeptidase
MGSSAPCDPQLNSFYVQRLVNKYVPYGKDGKASSLFVAVGNSKGEFENLLFSQNENKYQAIASTQKMLSAWVAYKYGYRSSLMNMSSRISFKSDYVFYDAQGNRSLDDEWNILSYSNIATVESKGKFKTVSFKRILYNLLFLSANGSASAIAEATAGTEAKFVALMNKEASLILGDSSKSYFQNPHGLTDSDSRYRRGEDKSRRQQSSAYDLARLEAWIMGHSGFRSFLSSAGLLASYRGSFIKYGITKAAGTTAIASFSMGGSCASKNLIVAAFGRAYDPSQRQDQIEDFNSLFQEIQKELR